MPKKNRFAAMNNADASIIEEIFEQEAAEAAKSFVPSKYQQTIFKWVLNGKGNAVVEAVAGSGKTTTLVEVAKLLVDAALFVAFNKSIATMLGQKLYGTKMVAKTGHSVGFGSCRKNIRGRVQVAEGKYVNLLKDFIADARQSGYLFGRHLSSEELFILSQNEFPFGNMVRLVNLARMELVDSENESLDEFYDLMDLHDFRSDDDRCDRLVAEMVREAMTLGKTRTHEVDFTDMVWLPVVHGWAVEQYPWVMVDECQDISKCMFALLQKAVRRNGRMLFVGDRRQAIYGFAGADAKSFQNIIDTLNAEVLPLSVCYRCPTSVISLAQSLCPQIEARPGAPAGLVDNLDIRALTGHVRSGDMVLCRTNAPLLKTCYSLIAEGTAATVRGRDIGEGLSKAIDEAAKLKGKTFAEKLELWYSKQVGVLERRYGKNESKYSSKLESLNDKYECVKIIYARTESERVSDMHREIQTIFSENRASVVCSSIHKAKGLEERRVFILDSYQVRAKQPWQMEQERNLRYVAFTRAEEELYIVEGQYG